MKIHDAINQAAFAQLYYRELGKELTREQAKKNFHLLKNPDKDIVLKVFFKIHEDIRVNYLGLPRFRKL